MPELPEVETIARTLRLGTNGLPGLPGRTVTHALIQWARTLAEPLPAIFASQIEGLTFKDVSRRGKFLVCEIPPFYLLTHLRMSGDLKIVTLAEPAGSHDRVTLELDNNTRLVFNDTRKFGRMWFTPNPESVLQSLGPDALDPDLQPEKFFGMLHGKKRMLKPLLMDQSFLAGLGNIYTDEALFLARLHPATRADTLSLEQASQLLNAIRSVLFEGIKRNGASIDWVYRGGTFQNHFNVYRQTGKDCLRCGNIITRTIIGQRSTHYCPACQVYQEKEEV